MLAESAPCGQFVGIAAAVNPRHVTAAHHPGRLASAQPDQIE